MDKIWWNELWMGWPVDESYARSSNVVDAARLQGRLMLVVGELDQNVDPASTMQASAALVRAGVKKERIVLDPGMGFFLGPDAETSFDMLRRIGDLRAFGLPLLVSCSRKSFLGAVTGRPVNERGPASLAAELYAARHGVAWIRTHDVRSLKDALRVQEELEGAR
jgi:dihydropteroate synthase